MRLSPEMRSTNTILVLGICTAGAIADTSFHNIDLMARFHIPVPHLFRARAAEATLFVCSYLPYPSLSSFIQDSLYNGLVPHTLHVFLFDSTTPILTRRKAIHPRPRRHPLRRRDRQPVRPVPPLRMQRQYIHHIQRSLNPFMQRSE